MNNSDFDTVMIVLSVLKSMCMHIQLRFTFCKWYYKKLFKIFGV